MIALTASLYSPPPDRFLTACGAADIKWDAYHNSPNIGVVQAYHRLWEKHKDEDYLCYLHDDVSLYEPNWVERVCLEMMEPNVAIVGFGGATGIGVPDIYKQPYRIEQLIRSGYRSNQRDWRTHGLHETGECKVAVVDGFFMAVKGDFLREVGGWDWIESNFHCYDIALCLEAYRRGWEVRICGVDCEHHGGGTSTRPEYAAYCTEHATTIEEDHSRPHRWLYGRYRDLLPLRVAP
jgi:GT2 family glycosyltransferase